MTETKSPDEPALTAKRKPDLTADDQETLPLKSPKLQTPDETIQPKQDNHALEPSGNNDSSLPEPGIDAEEEDDDDDYEDDEDDDGDEEEKEEEEENGNATVDRKGKGILIEEEQDSDEEDDDASSDGGDETVGESDLSDDPLAEVDLDNILPSRTRRRAVHPGVYIRKDAGNNGDGDDSDDSEA